MMIAFALLGSIALVASLMVVLARNPVVSALWLALTFAAVAGIFVVLGAEFLAAIQLIVYAGAILVFVLFVVMLLNLGKLPLAEGGQMQAGIGACLAMALGLIVALAVKSNVGYGVGGGINAAELAKLGNTEALAAVMFSKYVIAFELTSLLLTAAVVGAMVLARPRT